MQLIHFQYPIVADMTDNHCYIAGFGSMPQKVKVKLNRDPEGNLTITHSCFYTIEFPKYPSRAHMRRKLKMAMTLSGGFVD